MSTTAPAVHARQNQQLIYNTDLTYADRAQKAAYIADKYAALLRGSVLDVGCDRAPLRALVDTPRAYVGVDMHPDADISINLDAADLPLAARSFDTVVCTDVLEHLERCHAIFDELCRVARRHVIVSLPNPLRNLLVDLARGSDGRLKYYGLPVDPPPDRHRWFFGFEEAAQFLRVRGERAGFMVEQLDCEEGGCPPWRTGDGRNVLASANVRAGTLWCLLRRADAA
ncbi:MAG: methyltransferase domain-containing protein [Phycisphaerales bacterium]|nr:methyltransferase domain-containing protein [Phycisphaerales bacterium]